MKVIHNVEVTSEYIYVDGEPIKVESVGTDMLKEIYHARIGNYARFYKMDILGKLGFVASELLLQQEGERMFDEKGLCLEKSESRAVILFGKYGCIADDRVFQSTISDKSDYFPSPSVFVNTLPNIVAGDIALRNGYNGETAYYQLAEEDKMMMRLIADTTMADGCITSALYGWLDAKNEKEFNAKLYIIEK
jgi:hypothetical protein